MVLFVSLGRGCDLDKHTQREVEREVERSRERSRERERGEEEKRRRGEEEKRVQTGQEGRWLLLQLLVFVDAVLPMLRVGTVLE